MNKIVRLFFLRMIVSVPLLFLLHLIILYLNKLPLFQDKIIFSYIINTVLAIAIFIFLYTFRNKYKDQLGFLYMAGSLLKFAVFFIFFYPTYKLDTKISGLEFAAFFTPYILCLFLETLSLIKLLNSPEQNQ